MHIGSGSISSEKKKKYFKFLTKCTCDITILLFAFWIWVFYKYKSVDYQNMYFGERNLGPTMTFFDANRGALGIRDVKALPAATICPVGY